jgi:AcrR family transcriptional regulator
VAVSGLSKGAFYYYFADKAGLFEACIDRFFTAYLPDPADGPAASLAGCLARLAEGYATGLLAARRLCGDASAYLRFVLAVVPLRRASLLAQMEAGCTELGRLYRAEQPTASPAQAAAFAEQSLALLEGTGLLAALHNDEDPGARFRTMLANYLSSLA